MIGAHLSSSHKHKTYRSSKRHLRKPCGLSLCHLLTASSLDHPCLTWPGLTSQPLCCHLRFFRCASPRPTTLPTTCPDSLGEPSLMPILSSQMPLAPIPLHAWDNPSAKMSCLLRSPSQCKILPPLGTHLSLILPTHVLISSLLPFTTV